MTERALTKTIVFYLAPDFTMLAIEAPQLANAVLGYRAYDWHIVTVGGEPSEQAKGSWCRPTAPSPRSVLLY